MRAFIISIIILVLLVGFISLHSYVMINLAEDINQKCTVARTLAENDNWDGVRETLEDIEKKWSSRKTWASLTISTNEIEQIEISLHQSMAFAALNEKSDFMGEFIMFSMLIDHIPHQEGFHIEEIL